MHSVDNSAWTRQVEGVNLKPGTLADQVGDGPTLLVFLRHFG